MQHNFIAIYLRKRMEIIGRFPNEDVQCKKINIRKYIDLGLVSCAVMFQVCQFIFQAWKKIIFIDKIIIIEQKRKNFLYEIGIVLKMKIW